MRNPPTRADGVVSEELDRAAKQNFMTELYEEAGLKYEEVQRFLGQATRVTAVTAVIAVTLAGPGNARPA